MATVFIVGGAGQVGRRLAQRLADRGHVARALHRDSAQAAELEALGATPVAGDLTRLDADGLAALVADSDVVVFTAGAGGKGGPERIDAIDGRGLELAVAAAEQAGVRHFLLVSAFPEAARGRHVSDTFEHYMAAKKRADVHLAASGLDWAILRPGTLTDAPGTGRVRAGLAIPYGEVPRDDVAAALVELVERPAVRQVIVELTTGETPVGAALQALAR
ncbi:SDR family oxidoreductase [Luteimonas sp. FCS-9]|uniref:SDR family oxidoreductase n=1 Tax=Luteimonas sp. FCS-9 TaxID=1547516 RepID=UPI00063EC78D|nr:SDR family oxidoreductase [Luteimonas sp. FCS-9]KLJ00375.1 NAD-dependent dehydratase [Luteimonas sp. FCS-9]